MCMWSDWGVGVCVWEGCLKGVTCVCSLSVGDVVSGVSWRGVLRAG